jgi:hypothetical protein
MENLDFAQIDGRTVTLSYSRNNTVVTRSFVANTTNCPVDGTGGRRAFQESLTAANYQWFKLEDGNRATPHIPLLLTSVELLCARYYQFVYLRGAASNVGTNGSLTVGKQFTVPMRSIPSIAQVISHTTGTGYTTTITNNYIRVSDERTAASNGSATFEGFLDAEL